MTLYKMVDGERMEMTPAEEQEILELRARPQPPREDVFDRSVDGPLMRAIFEELAEIKGVTPVELKASIKAKWADNGGFS